MSNPKWEEKIIVVNREELFNKEQNLFQGVTTNQKKMDKIINRFDGFNVMRRGNEEDPTPAENNAEINLSYKQLIPYAIIRKGDKLFVYERLVGGGEARLHGKISMGFGGHMNDIPNMNNFNELLMENLERELKEELNITYIEREIEIVGLINNELDDVGKVHLGILAIIDLDEEATVTVNEVDQLKGYWVTASYLLEKKQFDRLEAWSQICVPLL
jgi:predicted NUDIX family phosphoesterase